jgi:hypothetical protein
MAGSERAHGVVRPSNIEPLFRYAWAMGLDGAVDERRHRLYRSGRTIDWIKVRRPAAPAVTGVFEE